MLPEQTTKRWLHLFIAPLLQERQELRRRATAPPIWENHGKTMGNDVRFPMNNFVIFHLFTIQGGAPPVIVVSL